MNDDNQFDLFEARRPFLTGLAYRILGTFSEAEDAVQDTFVKWRQADRRVVDNPAAWLTTACTRRCIDMLRSARTARVDYVGAWLPEPIQVKTDDTPETALALAASLSLAFLLLLERLTPKERAAYLLREVFEQPYQEVAAALSISEAACRKLVSRAKDHVGREEARIAIPKARQDALLAAFQSAIASGDTAPLAVLMAEDVELRADGGGKVPTLLQPVHGREGVLNVVEETLARYWRDYQWKPADINGGRGALLLDKGRIVAALSLACDPAGRLSGIYIVRNPDKLTRLATREATIQ